MAKSCLQNYERHAGSYTVGIVPTQTLFATQMGKEGPLKHPALHCLHLFSIIFPCPWLPRPDLHHPSQSSITHPGPPSSTHPPSSVPVLHHPPWSSTIHPSSIICFCHLPSTLVLHYLLILHHLSLSSITEMLTNSGSWASLWVNAAALTQDVHSQNKLRQPYNINSTTI